MKKSTVFQLGKEGRPSLVLVKPSTGELVLRRVTTKRSNDPQSVKVDASFTGDVRVNVLSLKAARQLLTAVNAIVRAKEAELLKYVSLPE